MKVKLLRNVRERFDGLFAILVLLVTIYGTLMVFSAGSAFAETRYGDNLYFVKRQAIWVLVGLVIMYIASNVDTRYYKKYTLHLLHLQLYQQHLQSPGN